MFHCLNLPANSFLVGLINDIIHQLVQLVDHIVVCSDLKVHLIK